MEENNDSKNMKSGEEQQNEEELKQRKNKERDKDKKEREEKSRTPSYQVRPLALLLTTFLFIPSGETHSLLFHLSL